MRDLAVCASNDPDVFSFLGRFFMLPEFAGTRPKARNPCSVSLQPASSPPSSLPPRACPIAIPALPFPFVDQGQFVTVSRRQSGRFDQHLLDVLVPLLGVGVRIALSAELFSALHSPQ